MSHIRSTSAIVQIIVTEHDEHDRPIGESVLPAQKVFRAGAPDFWKAVDAHVADVLKASRRSQGDTPTPPAKKDRAKRR